MTGKVKPIPEGFHTATAYLNIRDAARAIEFYKQAFGAKELYRLTGPGGKVLHAEIKIGDSMIMLAEEMEEWGNVSPQTLGGTPVRIALYVEDVDAVARQAVAAGAKLVSPVADQFYGSRSGRLQDPFGHLWLVGTHVEDVSPEEIQRRSDAMFGGK